jgi:hypothetical protein
MTLDRVAFVIGDGDSASPRRLSGEITSEGLAFDSDEVRVFRHIILAGH